MDPLILRIALPAVGIVAVLIALTPMHVRPDFARDQSISQAVEPVATPTTSRTISTTGTRYRLTLWRELAPPNWNSTPLFKSGDISQLDDADPRAQALLVRMRSAWDEAPPNPTLNGVAIRTAGYVVPVEESHDGMREFLLVPYYGACIHIPPPPANQIIDVTLSKPVKGLDSMDTVWVDGVLTVARTTHDSGASTYAMRADDIETYSGPGK